MAENEENQDIFDETTKVLVDLVSESSREVSATESVEKDENENVSKNADDKNPKSDLTLEEEAPPPVEAPFKVIWVRDSGLNPTIDLDRADKIPIVKLDRSEIPRFQNKGNYDRAVVESEELQKVLDRVRARKLRKRIKKAELKAKRKQTKKWPKVDKIVKAERALGAPVAALHPEAPRHSTPKRVGLEELKDSLRHCIQHCSSFFNMNGQPSLSPGTWPDHLSWAEARKSYKRNYEKAVASHPSLAADLEHPSVYDSFELPETEAGDEVVEVVQITDEAEDGGDEEEQIYGETEAELQVALEHARAKDAVGVEGEQIIEEDEVEIIPVEELLVNPIPSTSNAGQPTRAQKAKSKAIGVAFPMDKYGSVIGHGINTFRQGVNTDSGIEACLEKIARQTALKFALNNAHIGARSAILARQEVAKQIEKYQDRLQYLTGQRRRLLQVLIAQQEKLERNMRNETEPTLSQMGLTLNGTREIQAEVIEGGEQEAETEEEGSRFSSNLSEPGLPDPMHPRTPRSSSEDPFCTCPGGKCRWYGVCRN